MLKNLGKPDILVNVAGVLTVESAMDLSEEDWDYVMDVNMKGTFFFSQTVARQMVAHGRSGKIICISSNGGKSGFSFEAHYCASKHAVIGFVRSLALELAPHKINVNAICVPGTSSQIYINWKFLAGRNFKDALKKTSGKKRLQQFRGDALEPQRTWRRLRCSSPRKIVNT